MTKNSHRSGNRRTSFITLLFLTICCYLSEATNVKWTPGEVDENNRAATAPRSQKYWDEHGIERPDYAKTDQEIAAEKRQKSGRGESSNVKWLIFCIGVLALVWHQIRPLLEGGSRLDGGIFQNPFRNGDHSREEARQARLAKFS